MRPSDARGAAIFQAFILIPVRDNDGAPFSRDHYRALEAEIGSFSPGATLRGRATGMWLDAGETFREPMLEYEIDLESLRQVAPLIALAEWACARFRQRAILIRVTGVVEVIRRP